ncbi:DNA polymerase III subunit delta [Shewanella sp. JM162201]|uniref:DNA polymerase III subunit delta n=1 Tax=Shewanella jiangmenensis TaxID=2837387 RepID=A0ABS5V471_9GAMM|nr:DNA polymerase III subunit delta [Shewanella jiangmenensis]MBT1444635.1 DNA polymerase III subunit delta [Shewanella jiangmenensis]
MRVYPEQLGRHLSPLAQCYSLMGDEPWLIENARSQLLEAARQQGFMERVSFEQDSGFAWADLRNEWQAMSLFASRRIIELTLPQGKPGADGSAMLTELMAQPNPDLLLIVRGPKLASEQTNSKWFKALDNAGIYLPCNTPEGAQFSRWLDGRISAHRLLLEPDAKAMLASLYEGNLLAAEQALALLSLLTAGRRVGGAELAQYFEDQSRFNVFQLADALLANQQERIAHMLAQLKAEGTALPIVLWAVFRELSSLLSLKSAQERRESMAPLWSKLRIWDKRKPLYENALRRLTLAQIEAMLALSSTIELKLKQAGEEDWTLLTHLCLLFDPRAHQQLVQLES